MPLKEISPNELAALNFARILLVDVRTSGEYLASRLATPTAFAPLDSIEPTNFALRHGINKDTPVYFLCATGRRAKRAAEKFEQAGFSDVNIVAGGLEACKQAGFEMTGLKASENRGSSQPISLERQVRIVAGLVIISLSLLSLMVHPSFGVLSILVASGLIFSGITNWCGLALMLAKAPWNKSSGGACPLKSTKSTGASCQ